MRGLFVTAAMAALASARGHHFNLVRTQEAAATKCPAKPMFACGEEQLCINHYLDDARAHCNCAGWDSDFCQSIQADMVVALKKVPRGALTHIRKNPNPRHQSAQAKRGQDPSILEIPLPPDRVCFDWEAYDASKCDSQWEAWDDYCWWNYTEMCERVDYEYYYGEDFEWLTPQLPESGCFDDPSYWDSESCQSQWERLDMQCYGYGDYAEEFYAWTEECEILELGYELDWIMEDIEWLRDEIENRDSDEVEDEDSDEVEDEDSDEVEDEDSNEEWLSLLGGATTTESGSTGRYLMYSSIGLAGLVAAAYAVKQCKQKEVRTNEEAFLRQ